MSNNNMTLKNHFLIAMPGLMDPNFARSVTLVCEHDEQGAIGLTLTRPTPLTLQDLFEQLELTCQAPDLGDTPVMSGGPVNPESGFVLHRPLGQWENTLAVSPDIGLTTSIDILSALARDEGPRDIIVALGYAGWGAGQLEQELSSNAWLTHPADGDMLFQTPRDQLWNAAAAAIGVDLDRLSNDAGHA